MKRKQFEVPAKNLRSVCDPSVFGFENTSVTAPLRDFIGQERAIEALEFGLKMEVPGYNPFVTGLTGTGRNAVIREHLRRFVASREARGECQVNDFCYAYNFEDPQKPALLTMEKGGGKIFQEQIGEALSVLQERIPAFYVDEAYLEKRDRLLERLAKKSEERSNAIEQLAREKRFMDIPDTRTGQHRWYPVNDENQPMTPAEILSLSSEERKAIELRQKEFMKFTEKSGLALAKLQEEVKEKIEEMELEGVGKIVDGVFASLSYRDNPGVEAYLDGLRAFILEDIAMFLPKDEQPQMAMMIPQMNMESSEDQFLPFRVNILVDNSNTQGAPIVFENHPNFSNLFGRIERKAMQGTYFTDHTKIKAGSLLAANGGFLVLNIIDLLLNPGVWQKFKRTLKSGHLKIEDQMVYFGIFPSEGLEPEQIPINIKVIAIGDPMIYQLLSAYDEDFLTIFKAKVEFDYEMEKTDAQIQGYAGFVAFCCEREGLLPFSPGAVAKVVEYGTRLVDNQGKLSSRFGLVKNLVVESGHFAREANSEVVTAEHVRSAIEAKKRRVDLAERKTMERIVDGTMLIDTAGKKVGQVNGLVVYDLGDFSFGRPCRITAQSFMGKNGIMNIERESDLSGPIFNKAILILRGYLGAKYAQETALSVSISLGFEQSYGKIEGDSASAAELFAILSSLSDLAIDQSLAITGSINQMGEIQPIGGVNQKIEGFFDVCKIKGLTGKQGVIIPRQNLKNLMLREDIVEAVQSGKFHVYAIKTVEEGMFLILGREAGRRKADGSYAKGKVNYLVTKRLQEFAENSQKSSASQEKSSATQGS